MKVKTIPIVFGSQSYPNQFVIDLLDEARKKLSIKSITFEELELEIGDRLGDKPYSGTGRAKGGILPHYLCEGSVWLNVYLDSWDFANISLVPFFDTSKHEPFHYFHHNFYIYWTDFNGRIGSSKHILGHVIPTTDSNIKHCL